MPQTKGAKKPLEALFVAVANDVFSAPLGELFRDSEDNGNTCAGVKGLSMHVAGDPLDEGRESWMTSDKTILEPFFTSHGASEIADWNAFWETANAVSLNAYWHLFGRETGIGHFLLHPARSSSCKEWHLDMELSEEEPFFKDGTIKLGRWAKKLAVDEERVVAFWQVVTQTAGTLTASLHDWGALREAGHAVAQKMHAPSCCLIRTIERKSHALVEELNDATNLASTEDFLHAFQMSSHGAKSHARDESIHALVRMFLLLSIYYPIAGRKLWIHIPSNTPTGIRLSFLFWVGSKIQRAEEIINGSVSEVTEARSGSCATTLPDHDHDELRLLIGDDCRCLIDSWDKSKRVGLAAYLRVAQRLSEVAVHEKQSLQFSLVVARGDFISKHVEDLTPLPDDMPLCVIRKDRKWDKANGESLVELIKGNHEFFQEERRLLLCRPEGKALFLGQTLIEGETVVDLSIDNSERNSTEDECYVIVVRKDHSIEVFHDGRLKLLYRFGKWTIPRLYGNQYKAKLKAIITEKVGWMPESQDPLPYSPLDALTDLVWDLVSKYRAGASFVFGNVDGRIDSLGYPMTRVLPFAEGQRLATESQKKIFKELAIQDGVTFVDSQSGRTYGRRFLTVGQVEGHAERGELDWGARRTSAKLITLDRPEIVSVAVSVDGTIVVCHAGQRLHEEEHLVPQVLFNALAQGSAYCLLAIPVTLLYRQRGFLDFSLAGVFALSAYACLMLKPLFAGYVPFCIVVGATSGIICTAVLEYAVFAPMHSRRGDSGPLLLMSLGLFICIEAILALSFGYETVLLRNTGKDISLTVWGARLSGPQAIQVMTLVVVTGAVLGLLYATRAGRMVRAAAADEELASVTGIPVSSVRLCLAASCGVIAGVGGALGGLDVDLTPGMGLFPFFYALAAVIIGGTGSVGGAVLAAFMLTLITNTSSMFFGSYWQDASAFVILAGFLLLRPQGFFGKQVKSATV